MSQPEVKLDSETGAAGTTAKRLSLETAIVRHFLVWKELNTPGMETEIRTTWRKAKKGGKEGRVTAQELACEQRI